MIKKILLPLLALAALFSLGPSTELVSQSNCPYISYGAVLTAGQWNSCFASKQDLIGYTPLNKAGDTMLGRLVTQGTVNAGVNGGFNINPTTAAPTSPVNGDMWITSGGVYARVNGVTLGPIVTPSAYVLKFSGINLNVTTDQSLVITGLPTTKYRVQKVVVTNPSVNFGTGTAPLGGIYTSASKGGFALVASSQSYASLTTNTSNTAGSSLDLTVVQTAMLTATTLFFSLSTAHGAAGTVDVYLYLQPVP